MQAEQLNQLILEYLRRESSGLHVYEAALECRMSRAELPAGQHAQHAATSPQPVNTQLNAQFGVTPVAASE